MLVSLKQHYALVMLHVCVFEATLCILSHRLELQYAYPFSPIPEEKICSVSGNTFFSWTWEKCYQIQCKSFLRVLEKNMEAQVCGQ